MGAKPSLFLKERGKVVSPEGETTQKNFKKGSWLRCDPCYLLELLFTEEKSGKENLSCHPEEQSNEGSQNGKTCERSEILRLRLRMTSEKNQLLHNRKMQAHFYPGWCLGSL